MVDQNIIANIIEHYGTQTEQIVCMEECAELSQAISKGLRGKLNRNNLIEEMADILICINILKQIYKISDAELDKMIDKKQLRNLGRIKYGENWNPSSK